MSIESNKQLVRDSLGAVSNGDTEKFLASLADDITWTFFGSHIFARTFEGKDDLLSGLHAGIAEVLDGGIKLHINSLTAEGDTVVVEAKGEARSKSGQDYNNDYCMVVTIADGKVKKVREYLDTELVTSVFGK